MRILRGKSSLDVSAKGCAWFVVGLVIATFVGGAVRTALSSDRLHQRIVGELKTRFPNQEFSLGQTEVMLSRGMWPSLGLKVKNLKFRQDVCGKLSFVLEVPQTVLPVDIFSLRKGRVRLGKVDLDDGKLHLNYRPCPAETLPVAGGGSVVLNKKPMIPAPSLDWRRISEHLDAIDLSRFTLTYERNATWKLLVHSMRVDLTGEMSAQGLLELQKTSPSGQLSHVVDFEAQGDDQELRVGVHSEFKEGTFRMNGALDLNTHAAVASVNARLLPVKDILSELHQMGFLPQDLQLKSAWLSCSLKWEGPFAKPSQAPVVANDCKVEGAYGRVDLERAEFWLDHLDELKQSAVLKISKLQMQPLLEALDRKVLPRVLARPGVWSGELKYLNPAEWSLLGQLEGAEVVFSNRSVRGKQVLDKLRTQVERSNQRIQARIDELELRGGQFAGHLSFQLKDDWRNGGFRADVQKLRFHASVQNLLVGGTLGDLKFNGEGALVEGELSRWDGDFNLSEVAGQGWSVTDLKVKSKYTPGLFHLEGVAAQGDLRAGTPLSEGPLRWIELQAKADIRSDGGQITSVTGIEAESKQSWRLKGSWIRDGDFSALLNAGKARTYTLTGDKNGLQVQERLR